MIAWPTTMYLSCLLLVWGNLYARAEPPSLPAIEIAFFGEPVVLRYDKRILLWRQYVWDEKGLAVAEKNLTRAGAGILLNSLQEARKKLQLNDWLYYRLMSLTADKLFTSHSPAEREILVWYLLTYSGFDTRLGQSGDLFFVYAATLDEVYESPLIAQNGKTFVNLTVLAKNKIKLEQVRLLDLPAPVKSQPFSFQIKQLPALSAKKAIRKIAFPFRQQQFQLSVEYDQTVIDWLRQYPRIHESAYFNIPMSATLEQSLLPQLRAILDKRPPLEVLEILVAFTRSAFRYQEDEFYFGSNKPMVAEEMFYYPFSDCEDRAALLFALIQKCTILPSIVVAYPNHMTVAIHLPNMGPGFITYKGRPFYICDPTSPPDAPLFGLPSPDLKSLPFEVLAEHK